MVASRSHPMLYILIGTMGLLTVMILAPLWAWLFAGLLMGYLGHPLYRRLVRAMPSTPAARADAPRPTLYRRLVRRVPSKGIAAGVALLVLVLIILIPLSYIGFQLVVQTRNLVEGFDAEQATALLGSGANLTRAYFGWPPVTANQTASEAVVAELVPKARQAFLGWLPNAATYVGEVSVGIFVTLFVAFYAIKDGRRMIAFVEEVLPLRPTTEKRLIAEVRSALDAVLIGQLLTAVMQGALLAVGFWIFGVPAAIFWGFVATILSVLPLIGPPLVWGPAAIWLFMNGNTGAGVGLLIWGGVLVSTMDNIVKPKLMARQSGMHPTLALLGVLGGLISFGFAGFIIGPIILALFLILVQIYVDDRYEGMDFEAGQAGDTRAPNHVELEDDDGS